MQHGAITITDVERFFPFIIDIKSYFFARNHRDVILDTVNNQVHAKIRTGHDGRSGREPGSRQGRSQGIILVAAVGSTLGLNSQQNKKDYDYQQGQPGQQLLLQGDTGFGRLGLLQRQLYDPACRWPRPAEPHRFYPRRALLSGGAAASFAAVKRAAYAFVATAS